jgi:8-oxo-dGTP pyrophosphatase MutT (NUDIX family)
LESKDEGPLKSAPPTLLPRAGRALLLADLDAYAQAWPDHESESLRRYRAFVESTPECCLRSHLAGHCTGSALICCPYGERVLLLFHPFLQRWLQPGGHADGCLDLQDVARREAHEETGLPLAELSPYRFGSLGRRVPLDLDIHPIPARGAEPAHLHYDLRFLFIASPALELVPETPTLQLEWLSLDQVAARTNEESVLRMIGKVRHLPSGPDGRLIGA